jgi:hypothetical protein
MRVLAFDTETSIGNTIHEGTFRDPNNDIYTMIWAIHPSSVVIKHCIGGFNRIPPKELLDEISRADVIIGHNLSFDLC